MPVDANGEASFQYDVRSAAQLDVLASSPLPLGITERPPQRSRHRDLYLDTADDSLHRRGIVCRLRAGEGGVHCLSIFGRAGHGAGTPRVDATVHTADFSSALAEDTTVRRQLQALTAPDQLELRLEVEVQRVTRFVHPDFFRRHRFELHFDRLTVRRSGNERSFYRLCGHLCHGPASELRRLAGAIEAQHTLRPATSDVREHAELLLRWIGPTIESRRAGVAGSDQAIPVPHYGDRVASEYLNPELSLLAFQARVLALAEDPLTPLKERLRFVAIVSANIDELYMVRMAGLRRAAGGRASDAEERDEDGFTAEERLARVESELALLLERQAACARHCLDAAAEAGVRLVRWKALTEAERAVLRARCRDEIHPALTPLAVTLSPGHPLPHLPHLALSIALVFRSGPDDRPHLAELELPTDVARLIPIPGRQGDLIAIEELIRSNTDLIYPNAIIDSAHLFRVTRGADLPLDEEGAADLLTAVSAATDRRPSNPAVRLEVERAMPSFVCDLVLESLRRDAAVQGMDDVVEDVQTVDGLLDLRVLASLPLPADPAHEYTPLRGKVPVPPTRSMFDALRERELLLHHPFDDFEHSVVRFLREAADDRAVTTIKITLYRVGDPSQIVEALLDAARSGKRVAAFVELKARFDEEQNVTWARALERAGGNVVYGLVGLKLHAKVALVVRREEGSQRLERFVHVGTGNYNARSGKQYTDLSLLTTRADVVADVSDLFNELTGSSRPPHGLTNGALVAPHQLLPAILSLIEREAEHAREGRPAGITIKVNGLSDPEVVRALYDASRAGVRVALVVRGICTLRPGVPGLSDNITVVSVVGRFLEHSRIYRFMNGDAPEYLIGSADLRPRNLRRRVELLVPVIDAQHRAELDRVLEGYLSDGTAWHLDGSGAYAQDTARGPGAQSLLAEHALELS